MLSRGVYAAVAVSLMGLQQVSAAFGDEAVTFWSTSDCGTDPKTAFTALAMEDLVDPAWDDQCRSSSIDFDSWPQNGGQYQAFIDPNFLKDGCKLIFYNSPADGDTSVFDCNSGSPTVAVGPKSGCVPVELSPEYRMGVCCGDACNKYLPSQPNKRDLASRDVTAIKRAPIVSSISKRKSLFGECKFRKTKDATIQYRKAQKTGQSVKCPATKQSDCLVSGDYMATAGTSHSTSDSHSVTTGLNDFLQFFTVQASYTYDHTTTDETNESKSFSQSYTLPIPAGTTGYLTFKQKMLCGQGVWEGDGCDESLLNGGIDWCIPALTRSSDGKTVPDGVWSVFTLYGQV